MTELKKIIHTEIQKATVKIFVNSELKGTGFFITPNGYLLTAYHCIKDYELGIELETSTGEKFKAQLDEDNSLKKWDIAVLKANSTPSHCIPIAQVPQKPADNEIVVLGSPIQQNIKSGKISDIQKYQIELSDSIKNVGQSGWLIFDHTIKRVIGLTLGDGQAICFTPLFAIWPEMEDTSNEVAKVWEEQLRKLLPKTNNDSKTHKAARKQTIIRQNNVKIKGGQIIGDGGTIIN